MRRKFPRWVLVLGMAFLTAGCGSLPQPFAHSGGGSNPLSKLQTGFGVRVEPPNGMNVNLAWSVANEIAQRLEKLGVPASSEPGFAGNLRLIGNARIATILDRPGAIGRIEWRLQENTGREITTFVQWVRGDSPGWSEGDPKLVPVIAVDAVAPVVEVLAVDQRNEVAARPISQVSGYPRIAVIDVINAPGDGSTSLPPALRQALARHGVPIAADVLDAAYVVAGEVDITPPKDGLQNIAITWRLRRRDGEEVGKISQSNRIPAGSLNGRWGSVAGNVATAASPGIAQAVAEVEAARVRNQR